MLPRMSRALAATLVALTIATAAIGCGSEDDATSQGSSTAASGDPGPVHVHGLGVDPADGALLIATHTGLYRAAEDERTARRVGDRQQDTMGFTVVGPRRYLGSGHPDLRDDLPPFLGLIESRDGGESWKPVSLLGKRDFHLLEAAGRFVYGYGSDFETGAASLLISSDRGRHWSERQVPEPLISLAVDPSAPARLVAAGQRALYLLDARGRSQVVLRGGPVGLLAFVGDGRRVVERLVVLDGAGRVWRSSNRGWQTVGAIGGEPAALETGPGELLAALHDGTVKHSTDGGRTWRIRSAP
jgi:hypothetical protein